MVSRAAPPPPLSQQTSLSVTATPDDSGGGGGGGRSSGGAGQTEPTSETTTSSRATINPRGLSTERGSGDPKPRLVSKPAGVGDGSMPGARERRPPAAVFNGVRRSFRKGGLGGRPRGARGAGGGGRYIGTGGKGEGKMLSELVMFDEIKMQVRFF